MLPPLIQRPRRSPPNRRRERGITLALVAVAIFSIVAMAGLSIDVGTLYQASAEAQRAADTAALAGARMISMSGLTGDPNNPSTWQQICGGTSSPATLAAAAVAQQNTVGGSSLPITAITVTYSAGSSIGSTFTDCSLLAPLSGFGVNPVVTVQVVQSNLPTYFSRIWGRTGSSVGATASAEAFNPSNSSSYASGGTVVPVQPRCVKPWMVPNFDPVGGCTTNCNSFVVPATGVIQSPGILADSGFGVIGEKFWLLPDCKPTGPPCTLLSTITPIQANVGSPRMPNLEYLPGQASYPSTAVPSDGTDACSAATADYYAEAIAGCDQSTQYQCGKTLQNVVDLSENPELADTTNGAQCLIHEGNTTSPVPSGQDTLLPVGSKTPTFPFQIQVGSSNPLLSAGVGSTDLITSSTSIVSLPIYDSNAVTSFPPGNTSVTVIGFLQVFINRVHSNGEVQVTVMNVSGCGNAASGTALTGTSPVPVRLITPP
jgi:hypothetical protein